MILLLSVQAALAGMIVCREPDVSVWPPSGATLPANAHIHLEVAEHVQVSAALVDRRGRRIGLELAGVARATAHWERDWPLQTWQDLVPERPPPPGKWALEVSDWEGNVLPFEATWTFTRRADATPPSWAGEPRQVGRTYEDKRLREPETSRDGLHWFQRWAEVEAPIADEGPVLLRVAASDLPGADAGYPAPVVAGAARLGRSECRDGPPVFLMRPFGLVLLTPVDAAGNVGDAVPLWVTLLPGGRLVDEPAPGGQPPAEPPAWPPEAAVPAVAVDGAGVVWGRAYRGFVRLDPGGASGLERVDSAAVPDEVRVALDAYPRSDIPRPGLDPMPEPGLSLRQQDGAEWYAGVGLARVDASDEADTWWRSAAGVSLLDHEIADLAEAGGQVWIATSGGILRYDGERMALASPIPAESLAAHPDGSVFAGTPAGLLRCDLQGCAPAP